MTEQKIRHNDKMHSVRIEREGDKYNVICDGKKYKAHIVETESNFFSLIIDDLSYEATVEHLEDGETVVYLHDGAYHLFVEDPLQSIVLSASKTSDAHTRLVAPMPGKIARVLAQKGDFVKKGQGILIIEAMKMENEITAPRDAEVGDVSVSAGQSVDKGTLLAVLK